MENTALSKRVKSLLEEKGMTQKELAEKCETTEATISRNLNGIHAPKAEIIEKIAAVLGVSVDFLLGNTNARGYFGQGKSNYLSSIKIALFNQVEELSDAECDDILKYVEFIKSKK